MLRVSLILTLLALTAAAQGTNEKVFEVKGVVIGLAPAAKSIEIRHEDIPGYMKAMTMEFAVKDTNDFAGLQTNDAISFRLVVNETNGWVEQVRKTGAAVTNNPPTTG